MQYAVLEANGKVNGIGEISNPYPSLTVGPIWMPLQIHRESKKGATLTMDITLSILDGFANFFHSCKEQ